MRTFLVSDTHFGHDNMYRFTNYDGTRVRPWADNSTDGDAIMVERWNSVVRPEDRVYHLGDVAIPRRGLKVLQQLNGRLILIKGNHDIFKLKEYAEYFEDIRGSWKLDKFILTHVPIHQDSVAGWCRAVIHGHLHGNRVQRRTWWGKTVEDTRYFNVSVEQINITPIDFEEIRAKYE